MANRIIRADVRGEYIKLSSRIAGAAGAYNAASLELTFDKAWDGTTKKLYFYDADGSNAVFVLLTTELLKPGTAGGAYVVPIPGEPLAKAGKMTLNIRGVEIGESENAERVMVAAETQMDVLAASMPESEDAPVEPTPTQAEQLQAEIDVIKADIVDAAKAADAAQDAASAAQSAVSAQAAAEAAKDGAIAARTAAETAEANAEAAVANAATEAAQAASAAQSAVSAQVAAEATLASIEHKLWFGTIDEYNALSVIEPDVCYHILEGKIPV